MEDRARNLYSHKFFPTSLATDFNRTIKESSEQRQEALSYPSPEHTPLSVGVPRHSATHSTQSRKRRNSSLSSDTESDLEFTLQERSIKRLRYVNWFNYIIPLFTLSSALQQEPCPESTLPSPAPSVRALSQYPSSSRSTSPLPHILEEDSANAQLPSKRKRRMSDAGYDSDASRIVRFPRRRRIEPANSDSTMRIKTERQQTPIIRGPPIDIASFSVPPTDESPSIQPSKRKRRLSDAEGDRPRKHPQAAALMVPRLQTVSNPFPLSLSLTDSTDIPTSLLADIPKLDDSDTLFDEFTDVNVESFNYSTIPTLNDYLASPLGSTQSGSGKFI